MSKTRFISKRWWCSTQHEGIWWQDIIDCETGQVWFWNRTAHYLRPWRDGDENIRDGYTETNSTWNIRRWLRLPTRAQIDRYLNKRGGEHADWMYFPIALHMVNQSIKATYRNVMDYVRFNGHKDFFAVAIQDQSSSNFLVVYP